MSTPKLDAFAALRYREFRALIGGSFLLTCAILIQEVALAYELYRITHDPLVLGLIGLAEAIPFMGLALFGGHLADRRDKRGLIRASIAVMFAGSIVLWWAVGARLEQNTLLWVVYGVIALIGLARGIYSPAASALKGFLVPREIIGNAATWASTLWQAGAVLGPASAGFLIAHLGLSHTLLMVMGLMATSVALTVWIAPRRPPPQPAEYENLWQSLREGIEYVRRSKIILYSISLDMFSVLFGGVVAILPVFAEDILQVGPQGLGILRAAPAVGAMLTILACAWYPPFRHAWRNLLVVVLGFGIATLVFGFSQNFWLSAVALFLTGAFDSVSVVIRSTILQTIPPEHLRGRVLSVNSIFVSASNELGAFESGVAARLMGAVPSVIFGGVLTLGTVAYIWRRSRDLFAVRLG